MDSMIRNMNEDDRSEVIEMMQIFYASPAVLSNGSYDIFKNDFENCVGESPFLEGYIFDNGTDIQGYGMLAKSFSTEFGKQCIWIEDLYVKPEYRGSGTGGKFLDYVQKKYPDAVIRLEVEEDNETAVRVYKKHKFKVLPYQEMIAKEF